MDPITATQKITASINPTDRLGKPAKLDGIPVWASSNPNVAAAQPSADGLSCVFVAGVPGTTTISVEGDADLGDGVRAIAASGELVVVPAAAEVVEIAFGAAEEQ